MRIHTDELDIDDALVRQLVVEQFPDWAELPLERAGDGTVNVIYRLGDELALRLPRRNGPEALDDGEARILAALTSRLPFEIPRAVAHGRPGAGYPWFWSVHTWLVGSLPGGPLPVEEVVALVQALQAVDSRGAPEPGSGRGQPLAARDVHVRDALRRVDAPGALEVWERAVQAPDWNGAPVWIHCDLDARNVLVRAGRLAAVLDWGGAGAGDPALDVMVAWKLVARDQRARFRALLDVDDATWQRAQGWTVSQALIALGYYTLENYPPLVHEARRWLVELCASEPGS
jgi:aminoglycoside phosphotransferase (APT) family kinase protein